MKQKVLDKYPNAKMVKVKFGGMLENRIIIVNRMLSDDELIIALGGYRSTLCDGWVSRSNIMK